MGVLTRQHFRLHKEGSKFYETVSLWNDDNDRGVIIRRWGKATQLKSGGQTKIEEFQSMEMLERAVRQIWTEKMGRGYTGTLSANDRPDRTIWNILEGADYQLSGPNSVREALIQHYQNKAQADSIMQCLNMSYKPDLAEGFVDETGWTSEPAPDRGETWGSW